MKEIHELHTFSCNGKETYLVGTDENGNEISVSFNTYNLLTTLDIKYMKEKLNNYIKEL